MLNVEAIKTAALGAIESEAELFPEITPELETVVDAVVNAVVTALNAELSAMKTTYNTHTHVTAVGTSATPIPPMDS